MRLSILIPIYNWDVTSLLSSLLCEIEDSSLWERVEIILLDDSSSDAALRQKNAALISSHRRLKYRELGRNVGRAAIRNLLAAEASGEFLLFLDSDVLPDAADFVRRYLAKCQEDRFDVVCGGISYRTRILCGPEYDYHAYLGNRKEVKSASERNRAPWRHVLTSNIMVRKSVFQSTAFDERFTGYGYEDIEWGVRLAEKYRILHIDNTVSHLGLVSKAKAYEKMCNSVSNYLLLRDLCPQAFAVSGISKLVGFFVWCTVPLLNLLDRKLKRHFLGCLDNRFAFVFFQLNFAVLLACSLKERRRDGRDWTLVS